MQLLNTLHLGAQSADFRHLGRLVDDAESLVDHERRRTPRVTVFEPGVAVARPMRSRKTPAECSEEERAVSLERNETVDLAPLSPSADSWHMIYASCAYHLGEFCI